MKPRNFPTRKMARRIAAHVRSNGEFSTVSIVLGDEYHDISAARIIRTKKNRSAGARF